LVRIQAAVVHPVADLPYGLDRLRVRAVADVQQADLVVFAVAAAGGGLVAELMSHQIDFINWVTGSHPAKFSGFGGIDYWKDGRETYDNIHLLMEYPSGLDASFSCTTTNGFEDYQIRVLGSKGTIILDYGNAEIYAENLEDKEKGIVDGVSGATIKAWEQGKGVPIQAPGNDPTLDALQQFYDSVRHQEPVISDIRTGATTAKCVQIALDAVHQGEVKYWKDYPELKFS
jgi:predicted dehydrogenase